MPSPVTLLGAPRVALDGLLGARFAAVGLPLGGHPDGPSALRAASQAYVAWREAAEAEAGVRVVDYGDVAVDDGDTAGSFLRAHERLADVLAAGAAPLVLGGSALATLPTLQVLAGKLRGRLGVVSFSPSLDLAAGAADARESRWRRALGLGACEPQTLVLIGDRGGPEEAESRHEALSLGVRRYSLCDVMEVGVAAVAREALEFAGTGTEAVYISVDLGVVEGGAGEPIGMRTSELGVALGIVARAHLAAVDVCGADRAAPWGATPSLGARLAACVVAAAAEVEQRDVGGVRQRRPAGRDVP